MRFLGLVAILLPLIEIAVMILVGQEIGVLGVLGLLLLSGIAGICLLRWQGLEMLRRASQTFQRGEVPLVEMLDGFSIALAGLLLLLPGFVSDVVAILLLLPAVRRLIRGRISSGGSRYRQARPGRGPIIDAEDWVVEEEGSYPNNKGAPARPERPQASPWRCD